MPLERLLALFDICDFAVPVSPGTLGRHTVGDRAPSSVLDARHDAGDGTPSAAPDTLDWRLSVCVFLAAAPEILDRWHTGGAAARDNLGGDGAHGAAAVLSRDILGADDASAPAPAAVRVFLVPGKLRSM